MGASHIFRKKFARSIVIYFSAILPSEHSLSELGPY